MRRLRPPSLLSLRPRQLPSKSSMHAVRIPPLAHPGHCGVASGVRSILVIPWTERKIRSDTWACIPLQGEARAARPLACGVAS